MMRALLLALLIASPAPAKDISFGNLNDNLCWLYTHDVKAMQSEFRKSRPNTLYSTMFVGETDTLRIYTDHGYWKQLFASIEVAMDDRVSIVRLTPDAVLGMKKALPKCRRVAE